MPMVYLKERHPDSFLHFSFSKEGYRLRDFSEPGPGQERERQTAGRTADDIRAEAAYLIPVPEKGIDEHAYWHEWTKKLNKKHIQGTAPQALAPMVQSGVGHDVKTVIIQVIVAVLAAAVLAWLGLKD